MGVIGRLMSRKAEEFLPDIRKVTYGVSEHHSLSVGIRLPSFSEVFYGSIASDFRQTS